MNITQDIADAINKNLPQQVGDALRARLEQADKDAVALKTMKDRVDALTSDNTRLTQKISALESQAADVRKVEADRRKLELDRAVLDARIEMAKQSKDEHLQIVMAVFQNNRFKYNEYRNDGHAFGVQPTPGNMYPSPQTTTTLSTKTVETEG